MTLMMHYRAEGSAYDSHQRARILDDFYMPGELGPHVRRFLCDVQQHAHCTFDKPSR